MPSSYSGNLLLELMADGENDGLWGDITNENLEILGRAISGVTTVSLSGTTQTLTVTQGVLSEGHFMVLELGGSPSGTNTITINPNTVARLYMVRNLSGQDAVFTQGSGGNVTVPNGKNAIIYCNGAGSTAKVTDITAGFMRGDNNLSDLDSAATALTNLGLTATAAELNKVDGFTGTATDLNYAKDLRATGVTATEFDKLDGLTASTAELNILDGATLTTAELNHVDGVTSNIQTQLNSKISAVTAGTGLTGGGTSGSITLSHADSSSQGSVNTSGTTVIDSVSVDTYGHVTSMATRDMGASIRSEIGSTTFPSVGCYMLLRAVAGGAKLYNNTLSGGSLSVSDANGGPYISPSNPSQVVVIGGSWRCAGRSDAGTLTTADKANETTLWVRYA